MKKIFILVAFVAALACSCANKAVEVAETTENDTTLVVVDTVAVDSTAVVMDSIQ